MLASLDEISILRLFLIVSDQELKITLMLPVFWGTAWQGRAQYCGLGNAKACSLRGSNRYNAILDTFVCFLNKQMSAVPTGAQA